MATKQEDIVINLRTEADVSAINKLWNAYDTGLSSVEKVNSEVNRFLRALVAIPIQIVKTQAAIFAFRKLILSKSSGLQPALAKMNNTFAQTALVLINKVGPALLKMLPILGAIGGAVAGVSLALAAYTIGLKSTREGSLTLATASTALEIIMGELTESIASATKEWFLIERIMVNLVAVFPHLADEILGAWVQAEALADSLLKIEEIRARAIISTTFLLRKQFELEEALKEENLTIAEMEGLTNDLVKVEQQLTDQRLASNKAELEYLEDRLFKVPLPYDEELKLTKKIAQLKLANEKIDIRAQKTQDSLLKTVQDRKDAYAELVIQRDQDLRNSGVLFDDRAIKLEKERLEAYAIWFEQWRQDTISSLDDTYKPIELIDTDTEVVAEAVDQMDAEAERGARNRIAWQEFGSAGVLGAARDLSGSLAEIAEADIEQQKALRTVGVIIDTAAAIQAAWIKPGFPGALALIPAIVASGIAQIKTINQAEPGGGASFSQVRDFSRISQQTRTGTEIGRVPQNTQQQAPAAVLVTEDLNAVQGRVAISEDRAKLQSGGPLKRFN